MGDAFVWLAVGRMDAAKDYPTLLRAVARLPQDRPFVVLVAGGGPEYEAVEALGRELGVLGTRLQLSWGSAPTCRNSWPPPTPS